MRKTLIFLSLLLTVTPNASAKNNPTNALHVIIEKFESLSRITNGLALQKELNSKSLKIDHLLAEILGINPENNGFEELRKFKMDDLSKRYAKLSNEAGGVKKSNIDESMVRSQLDVLGNMEKDLEVIKRAETQNVDEIVEKLKSHWNLKRTFLAGNSDRSRKRLQRLSLPLGSSDIQMIFEDLQGTWFIEMVARNNETMLKKMKSDLYILRVLGSKILPAESLWKVMKSEAGLKKVEVFLKIWESAISNLVDITTVQALKKSSEGVGKCLNDLSPVVSNLNITEVKQLFDELKSIDEAATIISDLMPNFDKIDVLKKTEIFKALRKELMKVDPKQRTSSILDAVTKMKENQDFQDLLSGSLEAYGNMVKIQQTRIEDLLNRKWENWDTLSKTQEILKGTNLIETLECLQQKKFDATGVSKLLTFGSMIRSIGDEYKKDKSMETFIGQVDQFQKSLRNLAASVRPKRSPSNSTVDSLQNGLTVSQDLSKGVDLLRKMGNLYGKKKDLDSGGGWRERSFSRDSKYDRVC
ncbi:hypothetical protein L5515_013313 [Caenorhabditis briggsae]|uniref:Domain of unknown function WSN domain-containing protein n=1 Tax=Caenorhabditis briggsae TaxID=6238 RepID=A0AAE9E617_CAEBR|nr:hypothetical protein L5515_013313 [Caenorhabditis briggsae]